MRGMDGVRRWVEQVEAHAAAKAGTTTCRFALRDPGHVCVRRDGREAHGPYEDCFCEVRAQVVEQGGVLRDAEVAASPTSREAVS